ncbi:MAG: AbrB/MazE/SpoVT family DNA-binding domain-containing protein [Blastocatellia bacterium]|jgi:bifunctional DNA-binding transcriptional regulator/antitoxin component of YhaV-PrlF toxin-antitoxin module|nr:AbrB/MazE/SpoVT family DNA-binding domain-containing protein [Blastocatellia bacterium]
MSLSKISPKRQVVIPEDVFKEIGAHIGDYVEFVKKDNDYVVKLKRLVDAHSTQQVNQQTNFISWQSMKNDLPPAPSKEERNRLLDMLQGDAEDDSGDIPIEEIKAARTSSNKVVEFD